MLELVLSILLWVLLAGFLYWVTSLILSAFSVPQPFFNLVLALVAIIFVVAIIQHGVTLPLIRVR